MSVPCMIPRAAAIISLAVCLWGCGTSNSDSPSFDATGSHPAGWVAFNGGNHRLEFRAHPDQCPKCHGSDILNPVVTGGSGGIANVGCSMTSFNGTICHANGHLPRIAPHALPFTNPALHGPLAKAGLDGQSGLITCQGCHATSQGGAGSNPRFNGKIGALINGCEDCHNLNAAHPSSPPQDNAPWRGPFTHQNARNLANACALCHGANLNGPSEGGDGPACSSCHRASPLANLNCTSCHGNPPDGSAPVGPAFPNIQGAHGVHNAINNVSGVCSTCHDGGDIGTLNHFNQAQTPVVSILATYNAKTGGAATYLPDTSVAISSAANSGGQCTNVSCHGGVPTPSFRAGAIDPGVDCTTCHQSRTESDQFNSYFSGRPVTDITPNFATLHDFHLQGVGLICSDCHDTVKLDPVASNHFKFLNTPGFDIAPSTTIRADVTYLGGSCTPANNGLGNFTITICHGTRSWTAP